MRVRLSTSLILLLIAAIVATTATFLLVRRHYKDEMQNIRKANIVVIDKGAMKLNVFDYNGDKVCEFPIACGLNYGNKQKQGDMKTPEGMFRISQIQDASSWEHDFGDGKGGIAGAYGPWFLRLEVPGHSGIGIHGTHLPSSLGSRCTEGCVRLNNDDVARLKGLVTVGTNVLIIPSGKDVAADNKSN